MKTDLGGAFSSLLAANRLASFPLGTTGDASFAYRELLDKIESSKASRLICRVRAPEELASIAKIGLLLADVVVVTGSGGRELQVAIPGPASGSHLIAVPEHLANSSPNVATIAFPPSVLDPWVEDARDFIVDGRLLYLPEQALVFPVQNEDGTQTLKLEPASITRSDGAWELTALGARTSSMVLSSDTTSVAVASQRVSILEYALPTLEHVPLRELYAIAADEAGALTRFRAALGKALIAYLGPLPADADEPTLRRVGTSLRTDVIEPEVAKLSQSLQVITQTRALRTAGAAISFVGLTLTAVASGGLMTQLASVAGSGAAGLLLGEMAEWRKEALTARHEDWYFGWLMANRPGGIE
jgi:hypothetical protein